MEKLKFSVGVQPEQPVRRQRLGPGPCEVYGCPRHAHVFTGVWNCRYHHGKSGAALAQITLTLRNHAKEFDWYEHMLNATPVDFLVGDVARKAPAILDVLSNENFSTYKARVKLRIATLLAPKSRLLEVAP
jgi:hypothetical protein